MTRPTMRFLQRPSGWWIIHPEYLDMGPYRTRAEAEDDARGIRRFDREFGRMKQTKLFDAAGKPGQRDLFELIDSAAEGAIR